MSHAFRNQLAAGWRLGISRTAGGFGLMTLILPLAAGCGQSGPERVPVFRTRGTVTFQNQALPGAFIVLHRMAGAATGGPTPMAHVLPDGTFEVSTYDAGDGAPPGDYILTVEWQQLQQVADEYLPGPNVLPARYSDPATSGVMIHVAEGQNELPPIVLQR